MRMILVLIGLLGTASQSGAQFPEPGDITHKLVLRGKPDLPSTVFRPVSNMAFSSDGRRFAAADEKDVVIWDSETGIEIMRLPAVKQIKRVRDGVTAIAFNADGSLLASGNYDGLIKVWDVPLGKERLSMKGRQDPVITLAFQADNKSLVSICGPDLWSSPSYEINVWDLRTGRETRAIKKGQGASFGFGGLSLSPHGRFAAAATRFNGLTIWDMATARKLYTLDEQCFGTAAFSPDSSSFAVFLPEEALIVWEVTTGRAIRSLKTPAKDDHASAVTFSPDGKHVSAIVTSYRTLDPTSGMPRETSALHVWEVASGKEILRKNLDGRMRARVFSADGTRQAFNNGDGSIRLSKTVKGAE